MGNFSSIMKNYSEGEYENNLISFTENFSDKIKIPKLDPVNKKLGLKFGIYGVQIKNNEIEDKRLIKFLSILSEDESKVDVSLGVLYYLGKLKDAKSVKILVSKLLSKNEDIVIQSLYSLGCLGYKETSKNILELLNSTKSISVKGEAIWALGKIGDNDSISQIQPFLNNDELKGITISALGKSKNIKYAEVLRPFLDDPDNMNIIRTVIAISRIKDRDSINKLIELLSPKHATDVSSIAVYALGELKAKEATQALIDVLREGNVSEDVVMKAITKIGIDALDLLIDSLKDDDLYIKTCSAKLLGEIGDKKAVTALVDSLNDDDIFVVDEVIASLGKIGDETAITNLVEIYKSDNSYIKDRVKLAITDIGSSKAFSVVVDNLDQEKDKIDEIMTLFNEMGNDKSALLVNSLKDKDKFVRISAINTLKHLDILEIEPIVKDVIVDEDPSVRETIVKTVGELKLEASKNVIIEALKTESNKAVIMEMVWTLGEINAIESAELLFSIIKNDNYDTILRLRTADSIVKFGEQCIGQIADLINFPDEFTREAAAYMLGKIESKYSVDIIKKMLNDKSNSVVSMAVNALANTKDTTSYLIILDKFIAGLIKEDALANYITKIGIKQIPLIPQIIKAKHKATQVVIKLLGYIDAEEIRDLLIYITQELNSDYNVVKSAILAMSIHGNQRELDIITQFIYDENVEISSSAIMSMDKLQKKLNK